MTQQTLDLTAIVLGDPTIERRFQRWLTDNPTVYDEAVSIARQMKAAGHEHLGMKFIFEVIRYQRMLKTTDPEGYKLNNIYTSRLARLVMEREPDLADFFATRELRSA